MRSSEAEYQSTRGLERKLAVSKATATLSRMLRNTLQSYPKAKLMKRRGAFGVSLDAETSLYISCNGNLTETEMRDLLVLFVNWLVADAKTLLL
jgi:hypothetical protein